METLSVILFVIFVIDSILLIIAVLLQSGRGGGLAGALGGISSADSALGVRAASQIEKATGVLGAIFFLIALALAFISTHRTSVKVPIKIEPRSTNQIEAVQPTTKPATATTPPAATTESGKTTPGTAATTPPAQAERK